MIFKSICQINLIKNHGYISRITFLSSLPPDDKKPKLNLAKPKKLSERFQKAMKEKKSNNDEIKEAVEKLADLTIHKKPSMKSDLLKKLEKHSTSKKPSAGLSFDSLFTDMRIEKSRTGRARSASIIYDQIERMHRHTNIYSGPDLEIFDPPLTHADKPKTATYYAYLKEREKLKMITMPPSNAFEEAINWTRDGKLWNFPIDNEQGISEHERVTGFHEHVFLSEYAKGIPNKKPIKIFLDLVINGLAHNPYISVKEKKDSIQWYVSYFEEHGDLIPEDHAT